MRFAYALLGYLASLITLSYMILWVWGWSFIPSSIDSSVISLNANPYLVDVAILLIFALQHSLMARGFFKERIIKHLSSASKSATYSIASSLVLLLIFIFWQPINGAVWNFSSGFAYWLFLALYLAGWIFAFLATFMIDHFALFGLHQGYRELKGIAGPKSEFQVKYFYKYIRHPIQAGTAVGLLATATMSYGHLLFSLGMLFYILIGLWFEERSLIAEFGSQYKEYRKSTPMLIPAIFKKRV